MDWAEQHFDFEGVKISFVLQNAARNGQTEALKWFHQRGFTDMAPDLCGSTALGGHLETLKYLKSIGQSLKEDTIHNAALIGNKNIIVWALENDCPKSAKACGNAALGGHFELLQWLHANGFALTSAAFEGAAQNGDIEMLDWLKQNNCPWGSFWMNAIRRGKIESVMWIEANYPDQLDWERVCKNAAATGKLDILLLAIKKGADPRRSITKLSIDTAICDGHINILNWAKENGVLPKPFEMVYTATYVRQLEVLEWLKENGYCEETVNK